MSLFEVLVLCGIAVLVTLDGVQIVIALGNRKGLSGLARGEAARAMLTRSEVTIRPAPAGPVEPLSKLSAGPVRDASPDSAAPTSERATRSASPRSRWREAFQAPELGPMPDYATRARQPGSPDSPPPPHPPPQPTRRATLLGLPATIASPPLRPAQPLPALTVESDDDVEDTKVLPGPMSAARASAAQRALGTPRDRAAGPTFPSMGTVAPPRADPPPDIRAVNDPDDDEGRRVTLKPDAKPASP